ncbi:MAG: geranylgeranyl reductase family protein [Candidatus Diapherotrites archaeon]|uniref:Geranylgeranyl reductase family protein n=1 Tax=Candidatus Iainarchaeum sp. TaxID=3101447 RepID=A0A7J4JUR2_9ARCH|nr:geranylgeranyl reductase family protein [Candidatus Diapherotrites archaeon]HIH21448.1 geranylgeranyl reductase family protein [Candidatus Diapherotrites archaeon]
MNTTITIAGAGPAGLTTARHLAEEGWQVTVLEEHKKIGKPMQCAGLISKAGAVINKLPVQDCILNEIQGARIFAPNGEKLFLHKYETVALVLDREKLDLNCLKEAEKHGVEVRTNCKLIDARTDTVFLQQDERGEMLKTKILVGADGANSKVRSILGLRMPSENFVNSFQIRAKGRFEKEFVELHLGNFAKGFFAWVVPESRDTARIGIGTSVQENAQQALDKFLKEKNISVQKIEHTAGVIPIGQPLKEACKGNALLVGDAGFHAKATTGGGIVTGSIAARIAAETITEHLRNKKPLKNFDKNLAGLNKDLLLHWKVRRFLNSQTDEQLNRLFEKMKKAKIEEFLEKHGNMDHPSLFAGKLLSNPKIWFLLPEALKALR